MELFNAELDGLPRELELRLGRRLEDLVRRIAMRYNHSVMDPSAYQNYTAEQLSAMISAIFALCVELKADAVEEKSPE